jgi:hypothetical protein
MIASIARVCIKGKFCSYLSMNECVNYFA